MGVASRSGAHHLLNYCSSRGCVGSKRKPRCIPAISCPRERLKHRVECACIRDYAKSRDGVTERISLCLLFSLSFRAFFHLLPSSILHCPLPSTHHCPPSHPTLSSLVTRTPDGSFPVASSPLTHRWRSGSTGSHFLAIAVGRRFRPPTSVTNTSPPAMMP